MIPRIITASCFLGFALLGLAQALYGPSVTAFLARFSIGDGGAGYALSAQFLGGVVGVIVYARLRRWASVRTLVAGSYGAVALGSLGFALSSSWPACLAAAAVLGLGSGGIDVALNDYFTLDKSKRGVIRLNILHGFYGVGAIVGPFLIALIGASHYDRAFLGCTVVAAALIVVTLARFPAVGAERAEAEPGAHSIGGQRRAVMAFVAFYVVYVGVEVGIGGWEPTHLLGLGYGEVYADNATSVFWFGLTLGRMAIVPLFRHQAPATIVTACTVGVAVVLAGAWFPALAPFAYAGAGLMLAPIYPTGLSWMVRVVPSVGSAMSWIVASAMIGGVIFPPLIGVGIGHFGLIAVPAFLSVMALGLMAIALTLASRSTRPRK